MLTKIESHTRFVTNNPSIMTRADFKSPAQFDGGLFSRCTADAHLARDDISDMRLRIFLVSAILRPAPAWLMGAEANKNCF